MTFPLYTVGHSTRTIEEFVELLREAGVEQVVDVRKLRGSRKFPQFDDTSLALTLPSASIGYTAITELAGRRGRTSEVPSDVNALWQNQSFLNYADYALTEPFHEGLTQLRALSSAQSVAIMCAEAVWWRCHRRIIADYLLAHGDEVHHLITPGRIEPAHLTEGAVVRSDLSVVYPAME